MNSPLWFQNLAAYSLQIAILVTAGALLPLLLRVRHPRVLLAYWQVLLAACLLLPALQPWRRLVTRPMVSLEASAVRIERGARAGHSKTRHFPVYPAVAVALLTGIATRLVWTALGLLKLRRYRRNARPLPALPAKLEEMRSRLGVRAPMYLSNEIDCPATFGFANPVILLHARFVEMPPNAQRAIACHELLHVRRKDWLFVLLEELIRAGFCFHPAMWWLIGRIHLTREQWVDRQVIELTEARKPYLEALFEIAASRASARVLPAPLFLSERQLAQRIALMLKEVSMSRPRLIASLLSVTGLLTLTGRIAVRAFPLQNPPLESNKNSSPEASQHQDEENVATVENQDLKLARRVEPVYPPLAKMARIQGNVVLDVRVEANGEVSDIKMQRGHPLLLRAALEAVHQWRFEPSPILPTTTTVTLRFILSKDEAPREPVPDRAHPEVSLMLPGGSAQYPEEAKRQHIQGQVALEVVVDENGKISDTHVLKSDHEILTEAALNALDQPPFSAHHWRPGPTRVVFDFSLEEKEKLTDQSVPPAAGHVTGAPPELLVTHRVLAKYPEEAKNARVQGEVLIELTVDEKGEVTDASVLDGPEPLRNPALDAARKWRFVPPQQAPVAVRVVFKFTLLANENPQPETNDENVKQQGTNRGFVERKVELAQARTPAAESASTLDLSDGVKGESKRRKEKVPATAVTKPPVPIFKPEPPYPEEARQAKIPGMVKLRIDIDTEGKVSKVEVVEPAGHGFDEKATETLRTWKFKPALRDGVPVPTRATVEVHFRLN